MAWSGESHYKSLDNAFEHLENGIKATTGTRMRSAKRKVISKPSKTTKPPDRLKNHCPKTLSPGRFRSSRRSSRLSAPTRTFEGDSAHGGQASFARILMRLEPSPCFWHAKSQERLREKKGKERYRQLVDRVIREMKPT